MNEQKPSYDLIKELLNSKSVVKQDVCEVTGKAFDRVKTIIEGYANRLTEDVTTSEPRVKISYKDVGSYEAQVNMAGDTLVFHRHTNVFQLADSHPVARSGYVINEPLNGYCGIINIYNFLADSFRFNRVNDLGYLVARIFVNRENHFFVEGKRQLGFLYNNFHSSEASEEELNKVIESILLYTLDFDLFAPPYENMKEVRVHDMQQLSQNLRIKTGKRLGFRFESDSDLML